MIFGFSHLTVNSNNIQSDLMEYLKLGYELEFSALKIHNSEHKKPLLKTHSPTHNIYYLKHKQLSPIELINHFSDNEVQADKINLEEGHINISIPSNLFSDEQNFWKRLGFNKNNDELILKRLCKTWSVTLKIQESNVHKSDLYLDSIGATSLAFIVKKLSHYIDNPELTDYIETEAFELLINEKLLNIIFLKSPAGIPVELIEIKK